MKPQVYTQGLFSYKTVQYREDIFIYVYGDCILEKDTLYSPTQTQLGSDLNDYDFVVLHKGTKCDQISYSVGECNYYLEKGIAGVFSVEEWFKTNFPDSQ